MTYPITLLLGCRLGDNDNSRLQDCLASLAATADSKKSFEILIKLDSDDPQLPHLQKVIDEFAAELHIRSIITPRGMGYADLHKAYLDLFRIADPQSELFWVISDDIELESNGWDSTFLAHRHNYADALYTLHTQVMIDFEHRTQVDAIEGPDPYPVWSRRWLQLQGGFGYTFSTDGWTSLLCHHLKTRYGVDRRVFVPDVAIKRHIASSDLPGSVRWNGIRKDTHALMLSKQMQSLLDGTAKAMSSYIFQEAKKAALRPSTSKLTNTALSAEPAHNQWSWWQFCRAPLDNLN